MIRTALCKLLGIQHPILQGGMAWVSTPELVVAVSEAGGLGIIGAGNAPPELIRDQIRQTKKETDKPFGLNIALFSPFVDSLVEMCVEEQVPVVATGAGSPAPYMPARGCRNAPRTVASIRRLAANGGQMTRLGRLAV